MQFFILCLLFVVCLTSCQNENKVLVLENDSSATIIKTKKHSQDSVLLNTVIIAGKSTQINSQTELLLSGDNKILSFANKIYISDRKLGFLLVLDSVGTVLKNIELGSSSAEFLSLESINIDRFNNELLVLSRESQAMFHYSLDGQFLNKTKLELYPQDFAVIDANTLAFYLNQNLSNASKKFNLILTDRRGKIKQRLFDCSLYPNQSFSFAGFLEQNDSCSYYADSFSDTVYKIQGGLLQAQFIIDLPNQIPWTIRRDAVRLVQDFGKFDFLQEVFLKADPYITFQYKSGDRIYQVAFNKRTNSLFDLDFVHRDFALRLLGKPLGVDGSNFVSLIDVRKLHMQFLKDRQFQEDLEQFDKELYRLVKNATIKSGQVIFRYAFRF